MSLRAMSKAKNREPNMVQGEGLGAENRENDLLFLLHHFVPFEFCTTVCITCKQTCKTYG